MMHDLRRSASVQYPGESSRPLNRHSTLRTPSLDTLIIRKRTRYPSDPSQQYSEPTILDRSVAKALLEARKGSTSPPQVCKGDRDASNQSSHPSRTTSGGFSSSDTSELEAEKSALRFNELAKRYDIAPLQSVDDYARVSDAPIKRGHRRTFWRYLSRSSSSQDILHPADKSLVRKRSVSNIMRKRSKLALNCSSLEQLYRLGGASLLSLPNKLTATDLAIPCCLAATGNYLALHGPSTPGIFRIPGQEHSVSSLYDHYVSQLRSAVKEGDDVQDSIGYALLPQNELIYSVHDVASAFKRFLWDIPGGILGSKTLFEVLKGFTGEAPDRCSQNEWNSARPRLSALAILSLRSAKRIALCSAVFGLLASIRCDKLLGTPGNAPATSHKRHSPSQEHMSSRALAVVFAPILLGTMTDESGFENESPQRSFVSHFRSPKRSSRSSTEQPLDISASLQRSSAAAAVIEMLLIDWEIIARNMSAFQGSSRSTSGTSSGHECSKLPENLYKRRQFSLLAQNGCPPAIMQSLPAAEALEMDCEKDEPALRLQEVAESAQFHARRHWGSLEPPKQPIRSMPYAQRVSHSALQPIRAASDRFDPKHASGASHAAWWEKSGNTRAKFKSHAPASEPSPCVIEGLHQISRNQSKSESCLRVSRGSQSCMRAAPMLSPGPSPGPAVIEAPVPPTADVTTARPVDGPASLALGSQSVGQDRSQLASEADLKLRQPSHAWTDGVDRSAVPTSDEKAQQLFGHANTILNSSPDPNSSTVSWSSKANILSRMSGSRRKPRQELHGVQHAPRILIKSPTLQQLPATSENEPPVARHISFRPAHENAQPSDTRATAVDPFWDSPKSNCTHRGNVGTLYAEIRRLKLEMDLKNEAILHLRQELDALRYAKDTATLSEKLRESERELKVWRQRAQWAETALFRRSRNRTTSTEASG